MSKNKCQAQLVGTDAERQDLANKMSRIRAEVERASRDRADMEEGFLAFKYGVEMVRRRLR